MLDFTNVNNVHRFEQLEVEVILASIGLDDVPIYTVRMRYPRIIHGEIMTHRKFSRNARSSRAVPVKTMLRECTAMPFIPWHWGANQKGMQAAEECNNSVVFSEPNYSEDFHDDDFKDVEYTREEAWLRARDAAVDAATAFMDAGYHKQLTNRLLEPFSFIDTLITATDWKNFFWLRDHEDAEPHFRDLARLVEIAIGECHVQTLKPGQWHLPYIEQADYDQALALYGNDFDLYIDWLKKLSSVRCARISYRPFDGNADYEAEMGRYEQLVGNGAVHASPFEHQATPDTKSHYEVTLIERDGDKETLISSELGWDNAPDHRNFTGWIQSRALIPGECVHG